MATINTDLTGNYVLIASGQTTQTLTPREHNAEYVITQSDDIPPSTLFGHFIKRNVTSTWALDADDRLYARGSGCRLVIG